MDGSQFDSLARALHPCPSRRGVLASALGGVLGLLEFSRGTDAAKDSAKRCKGLKGKKKRKCLDRNKPDECREDADCPDKTQACRNGRCQRICPTGACPGCNRCLVRLEADGGRKRLCADSVESPSLVQVCATDAECPAAEPLCIGDELPSCTDTRCGTCAVSVGSCGACQNDADCGDQAKSCQNGACRPICPNAACTGCNFCGVGFSATGDRSQVCANSFAFTDSLSCSTPADCPNGNSCIRFPTTSCIQPPCGQCTQSIETCP